MIEGQDLLALSAIIKDGARVFSFVIHPEHEEFINSVQFPDECRVICLYRNRKFIIPDVDFVFKIEDEVVILTHSRNLPWLNEQLMMTTPDTGNIELES
jgi:trk system potassium uptake protein TrkA